MRRKQFIFIILLLAGANLLYAQSRDTLIEIAANPQAGFNYPYFLFIPGGCQKDIENYLFVESNNTGAVNDSFSVHEQAAKVQAQLGPLGNQLSRKLQTPYLVPVFPRPEKQWKIYTHILDRDALLVSQGPMKRIDLQLIAMIRDAKEKLQKAGYKIKIQVLMSGYSSSGVFANRFACLHPEWVKAYSAGGINGLLMMPYAQWNGEKLEYPIGVADVKKLTGQDFNSDAFQRVHQFLYMGEEDTNDAVQNDDAYSDKERNLIYSAFGKIMQPDRWFACQLQYKVATHNAQFRTYSGVGHEMNVDIMRDLIRFYSGAIKE